MKRRSTIVVALVALAAASLMACQLLVGLESDYQLGADGGAGDEAGDGPISADGNTPDDGAVGDGSVLDADAALTCTTGCKGCVMYVNLNAGNDTADGCTPNTAKKTLADAVAKVTNDNEIHVCASNQILPVLVVDKRVITMRGGYDCMSWARATNYTPDGGPSSTFIDYTADGGDASLPVTTMLVTGSDTMGGHATVDGFVIKGSSPSVAIPDAGSTVVSAAMRVEGTSAYADIVNNMIVGADVTGGSSVALEVTSGALSVENNRIKGGNAAASSIGLRLATANSIAPSIRSNRITAGAGKGELLYTPASAAIDITGNAAVTLEDNYIQAGTSDTAGSTFAILDEGTGQISVRGNHIHGGGEGGQAVEGTYGYSDGTTGGSRPMTFTGNRIFGGHALNSGFAVGIEINRAASATITNNMIASGTSVSGGRIAIRIFNFIPATPFIVHNTILSGLRPIDLSGTSNANVKNNLFVLDPSTDLGGQHLSAGGTSYCYVTGWHVENDAFMMLSSGWYVLYCQGGRVATTVPELAAQMVDAGGGTATKSFTLRDTCLPAELDAGGACVPRGGACAASANGPCGLFVSWPADVAADLLDPDGGWRLYQEAPCEVSRGGTNAVFGAVATDLYDAGRSTTPSLGAHEYKGPCRLSDGGLLP